MFFLFLLIKQTFPVVVVLVASVSVKSGEGGGGGQEEQLKQLKCVQNRFKDIFCSIKIYFIKNNKKYLLESSLLSNDRVRELGKGVHNLVKQNPFIKLM